jgi:tight adherence protein B
VTAVATALAVMLLGLWPTARPRCVPGIEPPRSGSRCRVRRSRRKPVPTLDEMAAYLDGIARSVRAGTSLVAAERAASEQRPLVYAAVDASHGVVPRHASEVHVSLLRNALALARCHGGDTARGLDAAAAALRERGAVRADCVAHAAQAMLSAKVLTALPVVVAGAMTMFSPSLRAGFASSIGVACIVAGLSCNVVGWWWMRRIVRAAA